MKKQNTLTVICGGCGLAFDVNISQMLIDKRPVETMSRPCPDCGNRVAADINYDEWFEYIY
jgi:transcription elongation factor Elf1